MWCSELRAVDRLETLRPTGGTNLTQLRETREPTESGRQEIRTGGALKAFLNTYTAQMQRDDLTL